MSLSRAAISSPGLLTCVVVIAAASFLTGARSGFGSPTAISPFTICSSTSDAEFPAETPFLRENDAAMDKMMSGMVITPTGDVDRDFVSIMVPHHQGAIEMAEAVLRNGHNEQIKRLAQEVIVTQQQEIAAMRFAVGDPLPPSIPSPTQIVTSRGLLTSALAFFRSTGVSQ
jgi:Domain of unknown function (DUF305)